MLRYAIWTIVPVFLLATAPVDADEKEAEQYMKFFGHLVGVWECQVADGPKALLTYKLASNGKCLVGSLTIDGEPATEAIEGYDGVLKCWKHVAWYAEGRTGVLTFDLDDKVLAAGPAGQTYKGTWVRHNLDGQKEEQTVVNNWIDKDKWIFETGDARVVLERKKPE